MKVNFKKLHPDAVTPTQGTPGSAGYDLYAIEDVDMSSYYIDDRAYPLRTGLSLEIPSGTPFTKYVGLVFARSSLHKRHLALANGVGVIDSDYRGEIKILLKCTDPMDTNQFVMAGDRVAQLVIMPVANIEFKEVAELTNTSRGFGGFGSTDK